MKVSSICENYGGNHATENWLLLASPEEQVNYMVPTILTFMDKHITQVGDNTQTLDDLIIKWVV